MTAALGAKLGRSLASLPHATNPIIFFNGELGAGKTTFVGGLLHALGVQGPVRSPTYTLVEPYELAGKTFCHLDLYRLADPTELEGLGLRDMLSPGFVLLIEWADRGGSSLPKPDLTLEFRYAAQVWPAEGRLIEQIPATELGQRLLMSVQSSSDEQ